MIGRRRRVLEAIPLELLERRALYLALMLERFGRLPSYLSEYSVPAVGEVRPRAL